MKYFLHICGFLAWQREYIFSVVWTTSCSWCFWKSCFKLLHLRWRQKWNDFCNWCVSANGWCTHYIMKWWYVINVVCFDLRIKQIATKHHKYQIWCIVIGRQHKRCFGLCDLEFYHWLSPACQGSPLTPGMRIHSSYHWKWLPPNIFFFLLMLFCLVGIVTSWRHSFIVLPGWIVCN